MPGRTIIDPREWVYATGHKCYDIESARADIVCNILADDPVTLELHYEDAVVPLQTGHRIDFKGRTELPCTIRVQTPRNSTKLVYQVFLSDLDDDIQDSDGYLGEVMHVPDPEDLAIDARARAIVQARLIASGMPDEQVQDILAGVDPDSPESDFEFDDEFDDITEISMFQIEELDREQRVQDAIAEEIASRSRARPQPDQDDDEEDDPSEDSDERSE